MPPIPTTKRFDIAGPAAEILSDDHPEFFGGFLKAKMKTDMKDMGFKQCTFRLLFDKHKPFNVIDKVELDLAGDKFAEPKHKAGKMKVEGGIGADVHGIKDVRLEGKFGFEKGTGGGTVGFKYLGIPGAYLKAEVDVLNTSKFDITAVTEVGKATNVAVKAGPRPFGIEGEAIATYETGPVFAMLKAHQKKDGLMKEFMGSYKVSDGLIAATKIKHTDGARENTLKWELGFQKDLSSDTLLMAKVKTDKFTPETCVKVALKHRLGGGFGLVPAATYKPSLNHLVFGVYLKNME